MKWFKKKTAEDSPTTAETKVDKASKEGQKGHFKRFSTYQYGMLLVVLLIFGLSAVLQERVVLAMSEQAAVSQLGQRSVAALSGAFNYQLKHFKTQVAGITNSPMVLNSLIETDEFNKRQPISTLLPFLEKSYLFKKGGIKLRLPDGQQLSFASLDMLKRTEKGEVVPPDAYKLDDQWHIQVAAPVLDDSGNMAGTMLLIFSADMLNQLFSGARGKVTISQMVEGKEVPFVVQGNGDGEVYSTSSPVVPNWKLKYQLPVMESLIDRTFFWSVMAVSALLATLGVFLLMTGLMGNIRKDLLSVTDYANKLLLGETRRVPELTFGNFDAMARSMDRAAKTARKKKPSATPTTKKVTEKAPPQPKVKDDLDVSMQEEDESLLAMGADKPGQPASAGDDEPLFGEDDLLADESLDLSLDEALLEGADEPASVANNPDDGGLMGEGLLDEGLMGAGVDDGLEVAEIEAVDVPSSIFRAYDIRGVVGESLTPAIAVHIGRAVAAQAVTEGIKKIAVGYDGRNSSPELAKNLINGLVQSGIDVLNVGCVPSPLLYFAVEQTDAQGGVMVTGSHNPSEYNGFKLLLGERTLSGDELLALHRRIEMQDYVPGQGSVQEVDVRGEYADTILNDIAIAAPLKVVVDAGNGVASEIAPQLLEDLGCEVIPLNCEVDGNFPNHHPDPSKPENLQSLIESVTQEGADIGIAFDGDADRIGVVTNSGKIIWPDRLLMLFAKDVVSRNPGADIIFDVKCTRRLNALVSEYGGRPIMWKTGHSLIKAKMKETSAALAGEMSGHIFFKERWFGFDDAIYAATRLLEILGLDDRPADDVFSSLPEDVSSPEINIPVDDEDKFRIVETLTQCGQFGDGNITDIDGIRVDYADGWGLCRASNTTPSLVLRFEANDDAAMSRIREIFQNELLKIDEGLKIPA